MIVFFFAAGIFEDDILWIVGSYRDYCRREVGEGICINSSDEFNLCRVNLRGRTI